VVDSSPGALEAVLSVAGASTETSLVATAIAVEPSPPSSVDAAGAGGASLLVAGSSALLESPEGEPPESPGFVASASARSMIASSLSTLSTPSATTGDASLSSEVPRC
jgi:hypothetical protein